MNSLNKIYIEFGIPEHGWLPTVFRYKDFTLELDVSDVPIDPMGLLCDALIEICKGISDPTRVIWHLEPHCYYVQLGLLEDRYKITISESDELGSLLIKVIEMSGTFEEIITPFYNAVKNFCSQSFTHPHWNEIDPKQIDILTEWVEKARA